MTEYEGISTLIMKKSSLTGGIGVLNHPKLYVQYEEDPVFSEVEGFRKEHENVIPTPLARRHYSEVDSIGPGT